MPYWVVQGKIKSLEQIYLFSLPVKEYQIVDHFLVSCRVLEKAGGKGGKFSGLERYA